MPSIPAMGDSSNLSLQQFIGYIRENMGLNPKQAMDLLKIKTLSGVNLREAVEQLQKLSIMSRQRKQNNEGMKLYRLPLHLFARTQDPWRLHLQSNLNRIKIC